VYYPPPPPPPGPLSPPFPNETGQMLFFLQVSFL